MRTAVIGFLIGVLLLQQQASLWSWQVFVFCLVMLAVFAFMGNYLTKKYASAFSDSYFKLSRFFLRCSLRLLLAGLAGFCWAGLYASVYLSEELAKEWEGRDITVISVVDSLPGRATQGTRFNFRVEKIIAPQEAIALPANQLPRKLALGWYDNPNNPADASTIKPGERWRLTLRLKRP